jgi:hypothetical protein
MGVLPAAKTRPWRDIMTAKKKRIASDPTLSKQKKPAPLPAAPVPAAPSVAALSASRKLSALDAAALVLRQSSQPMSCPELIAQMAETGYWTSPQGKTPAATLYAALARDVKLNGAASRFMKTGPGRFAARGDADA